MIASDSIYALSSGAGKAGIAVIRLSGSSSREVLAGMAGSLPPPRRAVVRRIKDPSTGEVLDQAVVLWCPGPKSVTGEDVAEFHVHGSVAVTSGVFSAFGEFPDLRPAEPGEFTRRALANGRMDLVEVEGLADLLNARSSRQRQQAIHHLMGRASSVYEEWRLRLLGILARIEAAVDFIDEEGVADAAMKFVSRDVAALLHDMDTALAISRRASAVRNGIKVVLAGLPNTGKSSLLNALAKRDAAIVSSRPGTTRDVIEVSIEVDGMAIILADTAGLHDGSSDEIELIGMARTRRELAGADIVVWVFSPDIEGSAKIPPSVSPALLVRNKIDLDEDESRLYRNDFVGPLTVEVSARCDTGIANLISEIGRLAVEEHAYAGDAVVVRDRQKVAVMESIRRLNESRQHDPSQLELVAEDLRKASYALARITGRIDVEDLLTAIFSEFCIGK